MKGVKHYTKDGKEFKCAMHKMKDGTLHSGKTHTANSKKLFHYGDVKKKILALKKKNGSKKISKS